MATLLLMVIYIAFIGLGIPDSLFGAAWPAIYGEFSLPMSYANFVSMTNAACTFLSSLMSARLINRFGTAKVTAVSTALTAVALLLHSFAGSFWVLPLLAVPLGLGAGAIDSGLNNYVALHYSAMQMNFLHCFYGVGVSLSPFMLSFALSSDAGWRGGYRWVALLQIGITLLTVVTLPLWKKVGHIAGEADETEKAVTLSLGQLFRVPGLPAMWVMFFSSCAIELGCGAWGSTFLVEHKGMAVGFAAKMITLYYVGIAVGRLVAGFLSVKLSEKQLVLLGEAVVGVAILLLMLPLGVGVSAVALFLTGFGISTVYPNLMHITPRLFGEDISQSVMGTNLAAACLGILLAPAMFGLIAQWIGVSLFPYYLAVMFALLLVSSAVTLKPKTGE